MTLHTRAVFARAFGSVCWELREDVCKLAFLYSSNLICFFSENGFLVVGVPRCSGVFNIKTLLTELLKPDDSLLRRHRCLEILVSRELMRLEMLSHEQRCPVYDSDTSSNLSDCLDCGHRGITDLQMQRDSKLRDLLSTLRQ